MFRLVGDSIVLAGVPERSFCSPKPLPASFE